MSLRPVLRPGVRVLPRDDGWVLLEDPPSGLRVPVPPQQAALLDHLGGLRLEQILEVTGVPEANALPLLQSLALLGLLLGGDEEGREARIEARAAGPGAWAEHGRFALLTETRFTCGACGACCRAPRFGPLSAAEVTRLEQLAASEGLPAAVVARPEPGPIARQVFELAVRDDGSCVFLTPAGRCRVAEELGPTARPLGCQVFPYVVEPVTAGLLVSDSTRCATYAESSATGPPLHEDFDAWRPLLRAAAGRAPAVVTAAVRLPDGVWGTDAQLREALGRALEAVDQEPPESGGGRAWELVRNAWTHWLATLRAQGLAGDLARRVAEDFGALPLVTFAAPAQAPEPAHLRDALQTVWPALPTLGPLVDRALAVYAEGAPSAGWDPVLSPILRRGLRQRVHGLTWVTGDALAIDLLRELLQLLLTAAGARVLAQDAGAAQARAEDLGPAQAHVAAALARSDTAQALDTLELAALRVFHHAADLESWLAGPVG